MEKHRQEYLFLSESAILGGIETLMLRMANELAGQGFRVTVVSPHGPIVDSLSASVNRVERNAEQFVRNFSQEYDPDPLTVHVCIWCSHPFLLRFAYKIQRQLYKKWNLRSNSLSGIFIPAQYNAFNFAQKFKRLIMLRVFPFGSVYFMSEAVRDTFAKRYGSSFRKWPVVRLALPLSERSWNATSANILDVVSVGRVVVPFKAYNIGAIDIIKVLEKKGIPCIWSIWGEGENLAEAKAYAQKHDVADKVVFHGPLDYRNLRNEVAKHSVFVGMGTAALEAASCGIPTIVALAGSKHETFGYLYENPLDSIGEDFEDLPRKMISDVLTEYYRSSAPEKIEIGNRCRKSVVSRTTSNPTTIQKELLRGIQFPPPRLVAIRMAIVSALYYVVSVKKFLRVRKH